MAKHISWPRKQRTRQHVIADQSVNYVQRFIIDVGHTAQEMERDYGYDLLMFTYDERGYVEPDFVAIQVKAAESLKPAGANYTYDVDIRDYNLWMCERVPVILILFDAAKRRGYWVAVQDYFREELARRPRKGAKSVRVFVPCRQFVSGRAVEEWRDLKLAADAS